MFGAPLVLVALREPSTPHPDGLAFAGAILWRGVVYGAADGVLLGAFPILCVFALFSSRPLRERSRAAVAGIGALALVACLIFTAVYHLGYPDFRGSKVRKPIAGSVLWSAPTLLTLSPLGSPIAHIGAARLGRRAQLRDRPLPAAAPDGAAGHGQMNRPFCG